ncbi:MAG: NADH-quinone oxidoreductase subunit L [Acidimicrobiales bacterium]
MLDLVWLIPALPIAGFAVLVVAGRKMGDPRAGWLATATCCGAFIATAVVFVGLLGKDAGDRHFEQTLWTWLPSGGLNVEFGLLVDPLSITMALFITGVGMLIHLYSVGYMHGDQSFSKFFIYLNLFIASMTLLVLGNNLVLTFLGWEGVGTCSYLLISFWFTKEANASAGKKAFVTNRIGDWGFMVAMFLTFQALGTLQYSGIFQGAKTLAPATATAIAALLFVGAIGKSAQLPLYVWLPDAMAGPTPVSALIHAATMVTSGVYLLTRVSPIIAQGDDWLPWAIAIVGAATALFAATIVVAQNDIKKVLAYSTVSQLGYMFLAIGTGAYVAAVFHMVTHAFFKALLFLGSGSVIHGMSDEQDMRRMGGLRKYMPITAATFIVGWLAIAGVPPFAGFWSKDDILLAAYDKSPVLWFVGLVTAMLTAFYMARQVFLVFFGEERWRDVPVHQGDEAKQSAAQAIAPHDPHESPWTMTLPLVALAGLATLGGALSLPFADRWSLLPSLEGWLEPVLEGNGHIVDRPGSFKAGLAIATALLAIAAIVAAKRVYLDGRAEPVEPELLAEGYHYDEAVSAFAGGPGRDGFEGAATFDTKVLDGAVNGVAALIRTGASKLRLAQTGYVRNYALGITIGAVIMLGLLLGRAV